MTGPVHSESAFEAAIEAHLVGNGWVSGVPGNYRRDLGLDPTVLFEFVRASQPKAWTSLVRVHGSEALAEAKFGKRLASEIDSRGTLDVLRRGVEDNGVKVRLAFFKPGHALTPNLTALYEANLLVVTRQAHVSESNPQDSVDLLFLINGLPVSTAELKNELTNQNVEDAKKQYRTDRSPHDLVFAKRTVVHFAVDPNLVFLTTRLEGDETYFLPFNQGSGGPGKPGGKGNPPTNTGYRAAYLWEQVWQRDNWLDLFGRFIHEEKPAIKKGKKTAQRGKVVFPRYHQWHAVLELAGHAATYGPGRNYLGQHSAGSGKSNTIAWLAHRLSTLHTPAELDALTEHAREAGLGSNDRIFHKIIVVTDRVVLDRQLQDTIFQFDHTPGLVERIDKSSQQLAAALAGSRAQIIITTLQKFPVIAKAATDLSGKRFAVIVDEAHSSQSGESAKDLKAVLGARPDVAERLADELTTTTEVTDALWDAAEEFDRALEEAAGDGQDALAASVASLRESAAMRGRHDNLSFFAFTATPKNKTLELFGDRVEDPSVEGGIRLEPFHLYSMRQAIEEGFILDVLVNYLTYKTYFRLANGLGAQDPEVDKGKANAALARFVALHPSNVAQKAEIIVEHFRRVTRPQIDGQAKAMVVTRSRLAAVRYKQAIEDYIGEKRYTDMRALVAFSGKVIDEETGAEYTESNMNKTRDGKSIPETETAKRFKGDEENGFPVGDYQVLIVAEKYQTGFDEPRLHTMYVDKKLEGVNAVQTLSRLNRTMPGKNGTFVLDFANEAEDIAKAFKPFYEQSWTEPTDPNILFNLRTRILAAGVIDPTEMRTLVAALLTTDPKHHETLYAQTDKAVERYEAIDDPEDKEDFRTAVRDFVRTYAFLGQVVPFTSADLEELYYYGRILITRLPKDDDDGGDIDLGTAAVLTHIRTEKQAEQDVSLHEGDGEAVRGMQGGGRGVQHLPEKVRLSSLIDVLNDKFGMSLTEADQIWFDQQVEAAVADQDLREVAAANSEENFAFEFDRRFADVIEQRQSLNDDLFRTFFDKPEFQEALTTWARREVYRRIQGETGDVG